MYFLHDRQDVKEATMLGWAVIMRCGQGKSELGIMKSHETDDPLFSPRPLSVRLFEGKTDKARVVIGW